MPPNDTAIESREPRPFAWYALLVVATASAAAFYLDVARILSVTPTHIACDFLVFWTAAAASSPYDFEALTAAQHWYIHTDLLRPFAYPPTFLPWVSPFARLPMEMGFLFWTAGTALVFAAVWSRIVGAGMAFAALAAPVAALALIPGQMVFLQGAMLAGALALLRRRPVLAGLLLGVAATIKPQTLLLVPFVLAAGQHWRVLSSATMAGLVLGAASLALQGSGLWIEWIAALPRFAEVVRETGVLPYGITPASTLAALGIEGLAALVVKSIAALLALVVACIVFRTSEDIRYRLLALSSATLLCLPYAMRYELAVAAPAALALLLDRRQPPLVWCVAFMFLTAAGQSLALVATGVVIAWQAARQAGWSLTGPRGLTLTAGPGAVESTR